MKLADAHLHLMKQGFFHTNELEIYEKYREEHGIERGLIVGYEGHPAFRGNNQYILKLAEERRWTAPLAYASASDRPAKVLGLLDRGAMGLSIYPHGPGDPEALNHWSPAVLSAISERRAIVSINIDPPRLAVIRPFLDAVAPAPVLLSHMASPGSFKAPPAKAAAKDALAVLLASADLDNVHVKLSGFYQVSDPPLEFPHAVAKPLVRLLLDAFGPRRLVWGSDFWPALAHVSFAQTVEVMHRLDLPKDALPQIMGGNVLRLIAAVVRS